MVQHTGREIFPSDKTVSFTAIAATSAIKTSVATATTSSSYTGVALNGAQAGGPYPVPRTVSVTSTAHTGSYTVPSNVTFTGTNGSGVVITETLVLTQVNGGETLVGGKDFLTVTGITVDAQVDTGGAFVFGVQDIIASPREIRIAGAGNLKLGYSDGTTDIITALSVGERLPVYPAKIFGDANTTVTNVTLMF